MNNNLHELLFGVRRSIRYHTRRCRFFDNMNIWCKFLAILGGTATITALLHSAGKEWAVGFAALVTIFSAFDLVIGTTQKARSHSDFARQFVDLEKAITAAPPSSEEDIRMFTARRLEIEANEPPPLRILDMLCHNELCRSLGYDEAHYVKIRWYQRLLCQFIDVGDYSVAAPKCS